MKKQIILASFILAPSLQKASADTKVRGSITAKASQYSEELKEKYGQHHKAQLGQETKFTPSVNLVNQLRWEYSTLSSDITGVPPADKTDKEEFYLGENFLKYQSDSWVMQTGYQEVAWGEAFGLNYADIVNPKNMKETFYSRYSDSRIPIFMLNYKYFLENGSFQVLYSPEPKFSKMLPHEVFTKQYFGTTKITIKKEAEPGFFDENDVGAKLSQSLWGVDGSLYYFSYLDREPHYTLTSATLTSIALQEEHNRINTTGISLAKTLYDDFVLRSDLVYTQDKFINYRSGNSLLKVKSNLTNFLVSLDTPTYNKFSALFVFAVSRLDKAPDGIFREQVQNYSIAKLTYDIGDERSFDLSYTHEFNKDGHSLQGQLLWPINSSFEFSVGGEFYWGRATSSLSTFKNLSNVFFSLKNYFQIL